MKKVIFSIAVILMSAGAVVAANVIAKSTSECSTCTTCECPFCTDDCCAK